MKNYKVSNIIKPFIVTLLLFHLNIKAQIQQASDNCSGAPIICKLDGYQGNTSSSYSIDMPGNMCEICYLFSGKINNNSWLTFIADSAYALVDVKIYNCSNNLGIQFAIYSGNNCNNFALLSDPGYTSGNTTYHNSNTTITVNIPFGNAPKLIPGQTYYVMLDGLSGDVCDYQIIGKKGMAIMKTCENKTLCKGSSTQLYASGGSSYKWSPNQGLSNPNIANPIANPTITTTYTVEITPLNKNCQTANLNVIVNVAEIPALSLHADTTIICSGNKANIKVSGAEFYDWTPSDRLSSSSASEVSASPLKTTIYKITGSNKEGCKKDTSIEIKVLPKPDIDLGKNELICQGDTIKFSCKTKYINYLWQNGSTDSIFKAYIEGKYKLIVTDSNNCKGDDSVNLVVLSTPKIFLGKDSSLCQGNNIVFNPFSRYSSYIWQDGSTDSTYKANKAGKYWVKVTNICGTATDTMNILKIFPVPNIKLGNDTTLCIDNYELNLKYDSLKYLWSTGEKNYKITIKESGTYFVTATNIYSCRTIDSISIKDKCHYLLFIPNTFSPNNDGINDKFSIKGKYITEFEIIIYNRWGQEMYKSKDMNEAWDGNFKNQEVSQGIYTWIIKFKGKDGSDDENSNLILQTKRGSILLIK